MIDKIKIKLDNVIIPDEKRTGYTTFPSSRNKNTSVSYKYIPLDKNKQLAFFEDNEDEEDDIESYKEIEDHRIKVTLVDYLDKVKTKLYVEGSIRKWFYGIDRTQDLTKKRFVECIDELAQIIGIEDKRLWNATVTKLETGVTIRLKEKDRGIVNCIWDYINFQKNTFGKNGVEFKGVNYDVIFYDQLRKIYNRRGKKEKLHDKLSENNFLLRYEIQGHKLSGMPMFKENLNTLLKIRSNWKYIGENLLNVLDKIKFVQVISPEIFVTVKKGEKKEMRKFLTYKGMQSIGLENFRIILSQMKSKNKSKFKDEFVEDYEEFKQMDTTDYKTMFTDKLKKRIYALR